MDNPAWIEHARRETHLNLGKTWFDSACDLSVVAKVTGANSGCVIRAALARAVHLAHDRHVGTGQRRRGQLETGGGVLTGLDARRSRGRGDVRRTDPVARRLSQKRAGEPTANATSATCASSCRRLIYVVDAHGFGAVGGREGSEADATLLLRGGQSLRGGGGGGRSG